MLCEMGLLLWTAPPCVILLHNLFQQRLVTIDHIINDIATADCLEMLSGTVNLRFLNQSQLHGVHRTLCFCHEIDVLDIVLIERNSPVRVVMTNRSGDVEAIGQFNIDCHIGAYIQTLSKRFFVGGVINDMVIQMLVRLDSIDT